MLHGSIEPFVYALEGPDSECTITVYRKLYERNRYNPIDTTFDVKLSHITKGHSPLDQTVPFPSFGKQVEEQFDNKFQQKQ